MKSIETIKKMLQRKELLTVRQTPLIKGGGDDITTILDDNKRPERPGGGVSTH
jgi:hypothetical protein